MLFSRRSALTRIHAYLMLFWSYGGLHDQYFHSEWDWKISRFVCVQDVDSAYLVKADLEDKVGSLTDEINFLRNIYEEVPSTLMDT